MVVAHRLRTAVDWKEAMKVDWPAGIVGEAAICQFTVSESDAQLANLRALFSGSGRGRIRPGSYTSLRIKGSLWMSDTPDEMYDHCVCLSMVEQLQASRVLVNGLGLGMVVRALCFHPSVETIDVVDIHPDVIALVGPLVREFGERHGKLVNVIEGDAHDPSTLFGKGVRWDVVWHDIWLDICADNWGSMKTLKRRYGRRCVQQAAWCEQQTQRAVRREKAYSW